MACPCKTCSCIKLTEDDLREQVAVHLAKNPAISMADLARELRVTEGRVVRVLPEHMRVPVPAADCLNVWERMADWDKVVFYVRTPGTLIEMDCALPKGRLKDGIYILDKAEFPLAGTLHLDKIAQIWLVSQPNASSRQHSVQFFTGAGGLCFGICPGQDSNKKPLPSACDEYMRLWDYYRMRCAA